MAIYHLSANVISRARGQSAVAAAAYRSGAKLRDERYGVLHDYTGRRGGAYSEIMAPAGAPTWVRDREVLWNRVESAELRKDSQLARAIEVGLPVELSADECLALVRDYTEQTFVSKGMIADFCIRRDNPGNPLAHILLTLREVTTAGFGPKARRWNGKANLLEWRAVWAERANEHLARAGHAIRIDHRTLDAQQIELTPARRVGLGRLPGSDESLPEHLGDRIAEQRRIVRDNGEAILEDPTVALRALAHRSPIFTHEDIARFLQSRTDGAGQYDAAYLAVTQSDELVALKPDGDGRARFTSRDMVEAAKSLKNRVATMATRRGHGITSQAHAAVVSQFTLHDAERVALDYLLGEGDAKAIALSASADKPLLLTAARHAWDRDALRVSGMTLTQTAAQALEAGCGIRSQSFETCEKAWAEGRDLPTRASVLVVDAAEMMSLKPLERLVGVADKSRAKIVLIGNSDQLLAMKLESPFQDVLREIGPPVV
ncbi:MAG: hypothetical protein QOD56_483 [Gammaproteobacteria bacterium]|nr:hypothetical protein [Gammaproteobacteria bacterium]